MQVISLIIICNIAVGETLNFVACLFPYMKQRNMFVFTNRKYFPNKTTTTISLSHDL